MKKKVLAVAAVVALVAVMVGGSLAYFAAEDEVTNTFTIGSVNIEIHENGTPTPEDTMPFGSLVPIVNTAVPEEDANYIPKVVSVKNTGINDAYVRTHIAIPAQLVGYLYLDLSEAGWVRQADSAATVDGVAYEVFTYDYTAAVTGGSFTNELLKGVYLGSDVDLEKDPNGNLVFVKRSNGTVTDNSEFIAHVKNADGTYTSATVTVLVASEAIQAEGFNNDASAALNAGFGANTNPWQ